MTMPRHRRRREDELPRARVEDALIDGRHPLMDHLRWIRRLHNQLYL